MKGGVLFRRLLVVICVLAIAVILFWPRAFTYHLADVSMVEFWDGAGRYVEIADEEQIRAVVEVFGGNRFWHLGFIPRPAAAGWSYRFRFFQEDGTMIKIYLTSSGQIESNSFFNVVIGDTVDLDFYRAMLPE